MFSSPAFWMILIPCLTLLFFLPTIIALIRGSEDLPAVMWLNALGLVIPVFGWIAAMGFACFSMSTRPSKPPRRVRHPVNPVPRTYDPGPFRGTPFESVARSGLWAEQLSSKTGAEK